MNKILKYGVIVPIAYSLYFAEIVGGIWLFCLGKWLLVIGGFVSSIILLFFTSWNSRIIIVPCNLSYTKK